MGKRSSFARRPMDAYDTPLEAVLPLIPFLGGISTFAEPCCGDGQLVAHLERHRLRCVFAGDIRDGTGFDALTMGGEWFKGLHADAIITNPPWTRELLHPLINRFQQLRPTWLLFDADWCHTRQAGAYLGRCSHIVTVGRVKWIPDSPFTGKDNAAWYRFDRRHQDGPRFFGRMEVAALEESGVLSDTADDQFDLWPETVRRLVKSIGRASVYVPSAEQYLKLQPDSITHEQVIEAGQHLITHGQDSMRRGERLVELGGLPWGPTS